jgi:hypothetical protein
MTVGTRAKTEKKPKAQEERPATPWRGDCFVSVVLLAQVEQRACQLASLTQRQHVGII